MPPSPEDPTNSSASAELKKWTIDVPDDPGDATVSGPFTEDLIHVVNEADYLALRAECDELREALERAAEGLDSERVLKELRQLLSAYYERDNDALASRLDYAVQGVGFVVNNLRAALGGTA